MACIAVGSDDLGSQQAFRSGVGLVAVDVQVVDRDGRPIEGLTPKDFDVRIDGRRRPIASAAYVRAAPPDTGAIAKSRQLPGSPGIPTPAATPDAIEPRTIVLAVDQPSFYLRNEPAAIEAATRLIDKLQPEDLLGLVAYPSPGIAIAPTTDRRAIREGLQHFGGRRQRHGDRDIFMTVAEAIAFESLDGLERQEIGNRECRDRQLTNCGIRLRQAAKEIVANAEMQASASLNGLFSVIDAMKELPGRTILVVVSAGVPMTTRPGGKADVSSLAMAVGRAAAASNIAMYTLYMDVSFVNAYSAAESIRDRDKAVQDSTTFSFGLERVSASAGGTLFRVEVGPHTAMERILRETSAYYLLGVEPDDRDRDGEAHSIRVSVNRRGAIVRARASAVIPKAR